MIKSDFIKNILDLLLDADKDGLKARQQIPYLLDTKYDYTGGGVFVYFEHLQDTQKFTVEKSDLVLDGVKIQTDEYSIEAEATLFFKNGLIDHLDIWCYSGDYPDKELTKYTLSQNWDTSTKRVITIK